MATLVKVAETSEIPAGQGKLVEAGGKKIALFNVDGEFYAIDDTCTHRGGPLSQGSLDGTTVTCPWHGADFDVASGDVKGPPAPTGVACYKVQVDGNEVKLEIP